jgi:hypothetical protein
MHRAGAEALVVDGDRLAALGRYEELSAVYGERARLREWDGALTPGRYEPDAPALLESCYWPDPREDLGSDPLTGDAVAALRMTEARWGASARRGLQRLLAMGTTAVAGPFGRLSVRTAVERSGMPVRSAPRPLTVTGRADFAVLGEDRTCLVTCIGGRLLYRAH